MLRAAASLTHHAVADLVARHGAQGIALLSALVAQQSAVLSYADAMRFVAVVAALSAPLPFLLRRHRPAAGEARRSASNGGGCVEAMTDALSREAR